MRRVSRLPSFCPTWPAASDPMMVPIRAMATVQPLPCGLRWYRRTSASMAPEMTTVSKPKSSPPSAPVSVAFIRFRLGRMGSLVEQEHGTGDRDQGTKGPKRQGLRDQGLGNRDQGAGSRDQGLEPVA